MNRQSLSRMPYGSSHTNMNPLQQSDVTSSSRDDAKVSHQARRGMRFEQLILDANKFYKFKRIAVIDKQQVQTQIQRRKEEAGPLTARVTGPSTVDYEGLIYPLQGRWFSMEAKSTRAKEFHVKMGYGRFDTIRRNQVLRLDEVQEFGGLAYWLICFEKARHVYIVPHNCFRAWANPDKCLIDLKITEEQVSQVGTLVPTRFEVELDYLTPVIEEHKAFTA